jgi:hypothetical protein
MDEGTVLLLAKHNTARRTSKVPWEDIPNTIDGGPEAAGKTTNFLADGCGSFGGQMAVQANKQNIAYAADEFMSGNVTSDGIIIKAVRKP